ncbi:class I SAM-dependent methyltransferase [Aquimarina sp. U1-2]|uniref:class I SAM-dependent methyltransferase n=1 Tax=Aquimarina sp. U1-2 TaxID=2823141 RepID=UPI001AEC88C0|nr:class I SAM-dependent methyltransferase [Aquimarina sp. U1-2]MBP2830567.1 class I SAM-dependent methyltransferase [Aquimarina sp. U1-2]
MERVVCTLCNTLTGVYIVTKKRTFFLCPECKGIIADPTHFLTPKEEKERYLLHQNDVNDPGYQNFVSPIIKEIRKDFNTNHAGLDFGSGSGPVVTSLLTKQGYTITAYDPFFDPNAPVLLRKYDYIVCCEVMEHFYNPNKEFSTLASLLVTGGKLYCKTVLYQNYIDFSSWWYKNDPTHVFFYNRDTLIWIKNEFQFTALEIREDLIIFNK